MKRKHKISMDHRGCCVNGCESEVNNRDERNIPIKFWVFPTSKYKYNLRKREAWIKAVAKHNNDPNWQPTNDQKICNKHFVYGIKHGHPLHPSYKPTIFPGDKVKPLKPINISITTSKPLDRDKKQLKMIKKKMVIESTKKEPIESPIKKVPIGNIDEKVSDENLDKKLSQQLTVSNVDQSNVTQALTVANPSINKKVISSFVKKKTTALTQSTNVINLTESRDLKLQFQKQQVNATKLFPVNKQTSSQSKIVTTHAVVNAQSELQTSSSVSKSTNSVDQHSLNNAAKETLSNGPSKPKTLDALTIAKPVLSVINNAKQLGNQTILNTSVKKIVGIKIENNKRIILVKNICKIINPTKLHFGCQVNFANDKLPDVNFMTCNRIITLDKCHAEVQTDLKTKIEVKDKSTMYKVLGVERGINTFPTLQTTPKYGFLGYSSIKSEEDFTELTGVSRTIFNTLLEFLPPAKAGYTLKFSHEDKLLMSLMKLKYGLGFGQLSVLFQIHRTTLSRSFVEVVKSLAEGLKKEVYWPNKEIIKESMPAIYKAKYPDCRAIVRCIEMGIEAPRKAEHRKLFFSNTNCSHLYKFLVAYAPNGFISFISKCYGERLSDKFIVNDSKILDLLEKDDLLLADERFLNIKIDVECRNCKFAITRQTIFPKDNDLELDTCKVDLYYEHIRRCIDRIKQFRILAHVHSELYAHIDDILLICCALINMQRPLVQIVRGKYNKKSKINQKKKTTKNDDIMDIDGENLEPNEDETTAEAGTSNAEVELTERNDDDPVIKASTSSKKRKRPSKSIESTNKKKTEQQTTVEIDNDFLSELGLESSVITDPKDKQLEKSIGSGNFRNT